MIPSLPQIPLALCAARAPVVEHYIGDTLSFAYTFLQPMLDAAGNTVLDAHGIPVPDPANPVNLIGSTMTGQLYIPFSTTPIATLTTSTDADTNLAAGKFKLVAADSVNDLLKPDSLGAEHFTRVAVIQVDSLGATKTLGVQHIAVVAR